MSRTPPQAAPRDSQAAAALSSGGQALAGLLNWFAYPDLQRLDRALEDDQVIRRQYTDGEGRGCVLWQLDHAISSREKRRSYFSADPQAVAASEEVVTTWDSMRLSKTEVESVVDAAIQERIEVHDAEVKTIAQASTMRHP